MAPQTPTSSEETALSLAMAVVVSSPSPLLLLDGDLDIIGLSASFAAAFGIDAATAPSRPLAELGEGEWGSPQLGSLLKATVTGAEAIEAYELDLLRPGRELRQLVIHAQRLDYLDHDNLRLLMAVTDVTDARSDEKQKDEILRQNLVLLREVRHRVANSLQIIASVLLQNARKARSDETRGHLKDAHNRVMSVAALERQLADSGEATVELRAYFTSLCDSLSASMIADHDQLSLVVTGTGGVVDSKVSVSLGLIVTELVINALKHAFPEGRHGKIEVNFELRGPNWVLSVSDDGVGRSADVRPGLGTSIVHALAKQLGAVVEVGPALPGTRVSITRNQIALVSDDPNRNAGQTPAAAGISGAA